MSAIKEAATARRVNFNKRVKVFDIPSRKDLSRRRIRDMWYNERGLYEINKVNLETVAMMTFGIALYPERNYCRRGLYTENEILQRIEFQDKSLQSVLREQELQSKLGFRNDELLAKVYFDSSIESRLEAQKLGLQDMKSAQRISRTEKGRPQVDVMVKAPAQSILMRLAFSRKFQEKQSQSKLGLTHQRIDNWVNYEGTSLYLRALARQMRMQSMGMLHFTNNRA
jgi:hypothetical protein